MNPHLHLMTPMERERTRKSIRRKVAFWYLAMHVFRLGIYWAVYDTWVHFGGDPILYLIALVTATIAWEGRPWKRA